MVMLFNMYYQSAVFEPRRHQTQNDLGQGTNSCLSRITQKTHTNQVSHAPAFEASSMWLASVYREFKPYSGGTPCQAGLLSRGTASNTCTENIELSKLSPESTRYRKLAKRRGILLLIEQCKNPLLYISIRFENSILQKNYRYNKLEAEEGEEEILLEMIFVLL